MNAPEGAVTGARADLLALTPEVLATLANRGLVKRATKELAAGAVPEPTLDADGTLRGRFPDGVETVLPPGTDLPDAVCSCAAPGICRHSIGLILAYQRHVADGAPEPTAAPATASPATEHEHEHEHEHEAAEETAVGAPAGWSPADVDDETLTLVVGVRAIRAARRTFRAGYAATVRPATAHQPVSSVELPTCTVRFLVPGQIGYAHTDAADAVRGEALALAVWAFRAAAGRDLPDTGLRIDVGGPPPAERSARTADATPGADDGPAGAQAAGDVGAAAARMAAAIEVVDGLLLDGAVHAGPVPTATLRRECDRLAGAGLHWPAGVLGELAEQLEGYTERGSHYRAERFATLITEMHARRRAAFGPAAATGATASGSAALVRSHVLGTDEPGKSPLRRIRLVSIGCRVGGTERERVADVFLANADSGMVLVLRKRWKSESGTAQPARRPEPLTGHALASRRVAGATLGALAVSNVVSESASRTAGRIVQIAPGRIAKTTVTPVGSAWLGLPPAVLVGDLAGFGRTLDDLPPRLIRPRVEAEFVRVAEIAEVRHVGYHAGDQRLEAVIADAAGTTATVSAVYRPGCPGALDALASALSGEHGTPRFISGSIRRGNGTLLIDPLAVMVDDRVIVPDLEPGDGDAALDGHVAAAGDPLLAVLEAAHAALSEVAHRGLRQITPGVLGMIEAAAGDLTRAGLTATAQRVSAFLTAQRGGDPGLAIRTWIDAQLQLITCIERR